MAVRIVRGDITRIKVDAIVNAANASLLGGGGVDGAIHNAAGAGLLEECRTLRGCKVGEAKITAGYNLPARFVIHTVGPVWYGGGCGEEELLTACYRNSLRLAAEKGIESIAFPLISSGAYGYPKDKAIRAAMKAFEVFLTDNDMDITLVLYDGKTFSLSDTQFAEIEKYISGNISGDTAEFNMRGSESARGRLSFEPDVIESLQEDIPPEDECQTVMEEKAVPPPVCRTEFARRAVSPQPLPAAKSLPQKRSLEDLMKERTETFSQSLLRLIDQKGMNDVEVYKRANLDRKLFSKIRSDKDYKPSKITAVALAIALRLNTDEAVDFIGKAGYTLSTCLKFDLIIRYFLECGNYEIYEINEALFAFDQLQLGV